MENRRTGTAMTAPLRSAEVVDRAGGVAGRPVRAFARSGQADPGSSGRQARRPGQVSRRELTMLLGAGVIGAAASPLLAACAASGAESQMVKAGSRSADIRLHVRAGSEADTLDQRIPEFNGKFPTIKVAIEAFPGADYQTKIVALMAAGSLGDALWGGNAQSQSSKWAFLGGLRQLDDFIKSEKFDLSKYYKQAVDGGKLDGKIFGLPFKLHPSFSILFYNVNAIRESGLKAPDGATTWEQLIDLSRRVKKTDGGNVSRWGFVSPAPGQAAQFSITWARSWGTDLYSADGKKAQLEDPKFQASMQFIHDLMFKHQVAPSGPQLDAIRGADTGFVDGFAGIIQGSSSQKSLPTRIKDKFEVASTLWPVGPSGKRGSIAISDYIHVAKQSKFGEEAWEFTKHLCDQETGLRLGEGTGGASGTCGARLDVYKHPRLLANPLHKAVLDAVENVMPFVEPWNFRGLDIENNALKPQMDKLWKGEESPTPGFFKQTNALVQQILDQPRGA